jgi:hypothetical protein
MHYIKNNNNGSGIFIQIGAGAGDQDSRLNYRDGFSEIIKSLPKDRVKKIILVEPNPINIPFLKTCWKDYPNAEIYQTAIVPKYLSGQKLTFYYCIKDAPHFQVASLNKEHVIKHYRDSTADDIKTIMVDTINIETFLEEVVKNEPIELLSLDIEGIDSEIVLDMDLTKIKISYLSYEYLHNGDKEFYVQEKLKKHNFTFKGYGVDCHGYDYLWYNNNI